MQAYSQGQQTFTRITRSPSGEEPGSQRHASAGSQLSTMFRKHHCESFLETTSFLFHQKKTTEHATDFWKDFCKKNKKRKKKRGKKKEENITFFLLS